MNRLRSTSTLTLGLLIALSVMGRAPADEAGAAAGEQEQFFEQRIRPLLAERCFKCHGAEKQEYGLRLDSRDAILAGGDSGEKIINHQQPQASLLLDVVRYEGDIQMPPDGKLADDDIEALTSWVKMDLPWSKAAAAPQILTAEEKAARDRATHWAFQPIRRPAFDSQNDPSINTPIDAIVFARLREAGLSPSAPADRRTLIRRAAFDLCGLPPTPEEVDAFLADDSPDAYARLIERLLASPHYGQRWGRHWLDVARYADTRGYSFGRERRYPYAYTYRDYVVGAFNADLPYDRFVLEQLAADQLPLGDDNSRLAALGFLTVGRKFNDRHDDLDDQIDVVCRGLLGLTVACARCHDHKYDGIPTEDYYSLYGVFASSREPDDLPLLGQPRETSEYKAFKQKLEELRTELDEFTAKKHAEIEDEARQRVTEYLVRVVSEQPEELLQKLPFISLSAGELRPRLTQRWRDHLADHGAADDPVYGPLNALSKAPAESFSQQADEFIAALDAAGPGGFNPLIKAALRADPPKTLADLAHRYGAVFQQVYADWKAAGSDSANLPDEARQIADLVLGKGSPTDIPSDELRRFLNRADRNQQSEMQKKIDAHEVNSPGAPPRAMIVKEEANPHDPRVFLRGNDSRPGKQVPRQFLLVLAGPQRRPFEHGGGRLELAQKIIDEENPLTRRVIANRLWMHHFGQALVDTPSDFGNRSDPPAHQQLLDYLAQRLVDSGWSLKALHREIMLSAVYQQASDSRPECAQIDPENRLCWRMNRRRLEFEALRDSLLAVAGRLDDNIGGKPVDITSQPFSRRRTVYGFIDRQDLPNLLRAFDFASPDQSAAKRPRTIVPQQALFLMNSPFVIEQAKAVAARISPGGDGATAQQIDSLYRLLFGRAASAEEAAVGREFLASSGSAEQTGAGLTRWEQYAQLLLLTNEFMYVD